MKTPGLSLLTRPSVASSRRAPLLAGPVLSRLRGIERGVLALSEGGRTHVFGAPEPGIPAAAVEVRDPRFWSAVALSGSVGAGEAYAKGWWKSDDPTAVVRLFVRNREALGAMEGGLARLAAPLQKLRHALRRNTVDGSRKNIGAHYDLSNEFFELFLDETLTYSCGIFEREDATLKEASIAKTDRLCVKLALRPGDHLLEIGTGWGALAIHAAREYGCRVTTTTISREQHALAAARVRAAGLEDRIDLRLEDYRALTGTYDKLVSVEMIEAVGHHYLDEFFSRCSKLLRPDGVMALQAITIADQLYESARKSVDFIKAHIFPGSFIPSVTALSTSMTRASDLRVFHLEDIGAHYTRTLHLWRKNLRARWDDALELGLDEEFLRLWEFYLCYCEGGYAERQLGDVQMLLVRPDARPAPVVPPLLG
jgi:cyclopropane-fatty-acyl-phospholipid synthase